jgi:hypothetical protein
MATIELYGGKVATYNGKHLGIFRDIKTTVKNVYDLGEYLIGYGNMWEDNVNKLSRKKYRDAIIDYNKISKRQLKTIERDGLEVTKTGLVITDIHLEGLENSIITTQAILDAFHKRGGRRFKLNELKWYDQ